MLIHFYDTPAEFSPPATYYTSIPAVIDRQAPRRYDAAALRDIKKVLESGTCPMEEYDSVAMDLMDECIELASDRKFWSFDVNDSVCLAH